MSKKTVEEHIKILGGKVEGVEIKLEFYTQWKFLSKSGEI